MSNEEYNFIVGSAANLAVIMALAAVVLSIYGMLKRWAGRIEREDAE